MTVAGLVQQAKAAVAEASGSPQMLLALALVALAVAYLARPRKEEELPPWVPLEIGVVGYVINSGGPLLSLL